MALMGELALYRKYRPSKFKDVLGQEQVTKVLEASIKNDSVSHAYIFAGSRGTGKTSVARIFAHELKVEPEDIYEIDAASNRGIEDIRAIREAVHTLPYRSPYKIYILDEAHMLTKDAWNALLKTLEEPPKHVIFIMATTEIEKVLDTVISRCQVFTFKKPNQKILKQVVADISKEEGYTLEPAGAELIAMLGDGSYRDTLSILQKIVSASKDKKISLSEIELITGAPKGKLLNDVLESVESGEITKGLKAVSAASAENLDMNVFLKLLLERVRAVLLLRFAKEMEKELEEEFTETDFALLKKIAENKTSKIKSDTLSILLKAAEETAFASVPEIPLELALMKISGGEL
jgi:DNA polymerase-3 subunit gamma/tau